MKDLQSDQYNLNQKKFRKYYSKWIKIWGFIKWYLIGFLILVTFFWGYLGFKEYRLISGKPYNFSSIFYSVFQLFFMEFNEISPDINLKLEFARWSAPIISSLAAINLLMLIFKEQIQTFRLNFFIKDHIIICGLSRKGLFLSQAFTENGYKVVMIEQNEKNEMIEQCKNNGSIVILGNAMDPHILKKAKLIKALRLIAVCQDDGLNAAIAAQAREMLPGKRKKTLTCIIHIVDPQLFRLLKEREFEIEKTKQNDLFRLEFFNLFDLTARTLIQEHPPFNANDSYENQKYLQPVIIGLEGLGESLILQMANYWKDYWKKFNKKDILDIPKISILLIDLDAEIKIKAIINRYKYLERICDLKPFKLNAEMFSIVDGKFCYNNTVQEVSIIYICIENDSSALKAALGIYQKIRNNKIPILIPLNRDVGLANLIQGNTHGFHNLQDFGMLDRVLKPAQLLNGTNEILAQIIHEAYCKNELLYKDTLETNTSTVSWNELSEEVKDSNRRQADYMGVKLHKIGCYIAPLTEIDYDPIFTANEIEIMAKMEHEHWCEEKLIKGWNYDSGPKNPKKKTHPSLISWEDLPYVEKEKDRNTIRKMPEYLSKTGFQIFRS